MVPHHEPPARAAQRRRRGVAALFAVFALLELIAAPWALAQPPAGTITIIDGVTGTQTIVNGEPEVCTFAVIVDFDVSEPVAVVGWRIKDWVDGDWRTGTTRLSGSGASDATGMFRIPAEAFLSLPDGRYNVIVDDEFPPDRSSIVQSFHVICGVAPTPTPTPTVEPTATVAPTPAPTGSVNPATGTPQPTLPPTDEIAATPLRTGGNLVLAIAGLFALGAALLLSTPQVRTRR